MNKILKYFVTIIFILTIVYSIFYQYQVESYINNQKEKYGILKDIERIKYKPIILFIIETKLLNKYNYNSELFHKPYQDANLNEYLSNPYNDMYMYYCYYNDTIH